MEAYELLKQHSIPSHFGITVSESNHSFITKSYKKFNHLIKAVTLYHTGGIFLTEQKSDYNETDKKNIESLTAIYQNYQPQNMGEWLVKMYLKLGILFLRKGRKTNIVTCDVGLSTAHLMANGDLQPCMYLPPITRLSDNFDLTCYHSKSTEAILEDIRQNKCPHCWMSCYGPHNMLQAPIQTFKLLIKPL